MLKEVLAIATDLWRHMPKETTEQIITMLPMKSMSQGVSTTLVAALDPKLSGMKASRNFYANLLISFQTVLGRTWRIAKLKMLRTLQRTRSPQRNFGT